jgi:hypothetical protein
MSGNLSNVREFGAYLKTSLENLRGHNFLP